MRPESILDTRTTPTPRTNIITRWQSPHPALLATLLLAMLFVGVEASAATKVWDGGGGAANISWTTAANWFQDNNANGVFDAGDTNDVAPVAGDDLVFPTPTAAQPSNTNNFAVNTAFNSITFNASGYTLGGSTVSGGAITITNNATSGTNTISFPITYATTNPTISCASGGTLTFSGNMGFGTLTLTVNTSGTCNLNGAITSSAGSAILKNTGIGTLRLGVANAAMNATIAINAGTLQSGNNGALGVTSQATTVNANGILDVNGTTIASEPVILNGGQLVNNGGSATPTCTITLAADSSIGGSGSITFAGAIAESSAGRSLTKIDANTLTLSGSTGNTFTGDLKLTGGIVSISSNLRLGSATNIVFNGGNLTNTSSYTISQAINMLGAGTIDTGTSNIILSGIVSNSGDLTKTGTGSLTLSNTSNSFSGQMIVTAGSLIAGSDSNLGSGTVNLNGGSFAPSAGFSTNNAFVMGASGGTINVATGTLTITTAVSGAGSLTKSGAGTLEFTAANTYGTSGTATTTVSAGTLSIYSDSNLGASTNSMVMGGGTLNVVANSFTIARAFTFNNATTSFISVPAGETLIIDGQFKSTGSFTKSGTGTLTLKQSADAARLNTLANQNTISAGKLRLEHGTALSTYSGTLATVLVLVSSGATLEIGNGIEYATATTFNDNTTLRLTENSTVSNKNNVTSGSMAISSSGSPVVTIVVPNANEIGTIGNGTSGPVVFKTSTATGKIIFNGPGKFNLTSSNTNLNATHSFDINTWVRFDIANALGGNANLVTVNPGGILIHNATATFGRTISLAGGTLAATNGAVRDFTGGISIPTSSTISLQDPINTTLPSVMTFNTTATMTGTNAAAVLTVTSNNISGALLTLRSTSSSFQGTIVVNPNVTLEAKTSTVGASPLGNTTNRTTVQLNGGRLELRSDTAINFNANLVLTANSTLFVDSFASGGNFAPANPHTLFNFTVPANINPAPTLDIRNYYILRGLYKFQFLGTSTIDSNTTLNDYLASGYNNGAILSYHTITFPTAIGGSGSLTQNNPQGRIDLEGANTFTGTLTANGTVALTKNAVLAGGVTVGSAGTLLIDDTLSTTFPDRIPDTATVTMDGGTFEIKAIANNPRTENIGALAFTGGESKITLRTAAAADVQLISPVTTRIPGSLLRFNRYITTATPVNIVPNLIFLDYSVGQTTGPDLVLPWATVSDNGAATTAAAYNKYPVEEGVIPTTTTATFITAQDGNWNAGTTWVGGVVPPQDAYVIIRHAVALADAAGPVNVTVAAVTFDQAGGSISGAANVALTVTTGSVAANGVSATINANLAFNNQEAFYSAFSGGTISQNGVVTGINGLTKFGSGTLTLSAANTYTGQTTLFAGTLNLGNDLALSTGNLVVFSNTTIVPQNGTRTISNALTLQGAVTLGASGSTDIIFSGPVTVEQSSNIKVDGPSATFSGNISNGSVGALALSKNGVGALRLSGANTFSGGFTLTEGALHLGSDTALGTGGLSVSGSPTSIEAFNSARTIANSLTITFNTSFTGSLNLSFTGNITIAGGSSRILTFDNAGITSFDGVVTGQKIIKRGAGTLKLTNVNTFSGIDHNEGKLQVGNNGALGSSTTRIQNVAVLEAVGAGPRVVTNGLDIDSDFSFIGNVDMTFNGTATLSGNRNISVNTLNATLNFSALTDATGSYSLTKSGVGTLTLTGDNTVDGNLIADGGIFNMKGDTSTLTGGITVNTNGTFTIDGQGTANINRIADTVAGILTLNGGTFKMTAPGTADRTETINKLLLKAGTTSTVELVTQRTVDATTGDCRLTATTYTREAGASLRFIRTYTSPGPVPNLKLASIVTNTGLPWATVNFLRAKHDSVEGIVPAAEGDAWITQASGTWNTSGIWIKPTTYTDTDSYPGQTNAGAEVIIRHTVNISHTTQQISTVTLDDTVGAGIINSTAGTTLQILGGGVYVVDKQPGTSFTHQINCPISFPDAGLNTVEGLFLQSSTGATADILDVAGAISSASHGGVAVNGTGMVRFSSAGNAYTGQTGIFGGTLSIQNDNHLGNTSNALVISGGTLQVRGTSNTIALSGTRLVTVGASGGTFDVQSSNTLSISTPIAGSGTPNGTLNKTSAGTLILSGTSTRVGPAIITGGSIKLDNASGLGAVGTTASVTGATLWLNGISLNIPIALNNGASLQGSGTTESIGTMTVATNAAVTIVADPAAIFTIGSNPNALVGGGGTSSMTVNGTGRVIIADSNSYSGSWTRNSGILQVNHPSALGSSTNSLTVVGPGTFVSKATSIAQPITLNNGATLAPMSGDRTFTGPISVTGAAASTISLFDPLNGTSDWNVTLTGTLTGTSAPLTINASGSPASSRALTLRGSGSGFTQPVTVNSGILRLQLSGSLGGNISMNSGTTLDLVDTGSATAVNRIGDLATVTLTAAKLTFTAHANTTHDEVFGTLTFGAGSSTITMTPNSSAAGSGDLQIHVSNTNLGNLPAAGASLTFYRNTSGTETANLFAASGVTAGPVNSSQVFEAIGPGPGKYDLTEGLRSTNLPSHISIANGDWRKANPFKWTGGGPVTVAFWVRVNTGQVQNSFVFGVGTGGGATNRFSAHCPWGDGNIYWDYGNINGSGRISTPFGALDTWKHIALVSSGTANTFKAIYINGALAASATNSHGPSGTLSNLFIGASPESAATNFQKGLIDDFRIYNRMLDATEINTLATSGSVASPICYYAFDENFVGNTALDSSGNNYSGAMLNGATWIAGGNQKNGASSLSLDGSNDYVAVLDSIWDTGANPPPSADQVVINGHTVSVASNNESIANIVFSKPGTINGSAGRTLTVDSLGVIQVNTSNSGLKAEYWQNNTQTGPSVLTRFDPNVDYNINVNSWPIPLLNTNFSVRWTGFVTPQFTETYTFYVGSDDGARLIVNGVTLFDRFSVGQGETEANQTATINLVAGVPVPIQLDYQQGGGGAACHLRWSSASVPKQVIPQSALSAPAGFIPPVSTISVDTLQFLPVAPSTSQTGFINFSDNGSLVISSVIPSAFTTGDGLKILANNGELTLSGANTYTGLTTLSSGTLYFGNTTALGTSGLVIEGGAIGASATISPITNAITAKGSFSVVGSNALVMSGNMALTGSRTITVTNTANTTFSGVISDGAGTYSLNKNGAGLLILSNDNTYDGGTAVNGGTLQADATGTSTTGTGAVTVATGAILMGSGKIAGTVSIDAGATLAGTLNIASAVTVKDDAIVSPATSTSGGAISTGPLTIANNSILNFNLPSGGTNDRFIVTGSCSIGGTMNIDTVNAFGGPGTYTIVSSTGTVTDTGLAVNVPGYSYSISGSGTSTLILTIANPVRKVWDGGGADDKWTTAANWFQDNNSNNAFDAGDVNDVAPLAGDNLVFAGTTRLTPVNDFRNYTPFGSITFAGSGFTVSGNPVQLNGASAGITNSTGVNNFNISVLMVKDITVAATDVISPATSALTVNGNIDNGGFRLTVNPGDTASVTLNGVVSGTGGLTTTDPIGNGGGTITLNAANTYSGSNTAAYLSLGGLLAEYYQNTTLGGSPTLVRFDPKIDSNNIPPATWPNPLTNTNFSVRWTGKITPPLAGTNTYRFDPRTDDGVRLWVNNVLIVNQWVGRGVPGQEAAGNFGDISLTGGVTYDIKMEFFQGGGGYGAFLYYRTLDNVVPYQIVPSTVLSAQISSNTATLLNGEGTVILGNDSALGVSNVVYNNSSTKLQASAPRTIANSIVLNSNATINGSDVTFTSTVPMVIADRSITTNNSNTYFTASPPISGAGYALTKLGLGQMVISGGATTFTKQMTIGAGAVKLTGAGAFSTFGANPIIISSGAMLELDNGTTVLDRVVDSNKIQLNANSTLLLRGSNSAASVNEAIAELISNSSTGVIKVVANGGDTRFTFTSYSGAANFNFDRSDLSGNPANSTLARTYVTNSTLFAEGLGLTFATVTDTPAGLTNVAAKYEAANGIVPAYTGGTYISLRTGNWNDTTMWSPNGNPGSNDVIIVDQNHVVSLNGANRSAALIRFTASGQITGANTLTCGSFIEVTGSGSPTIDCPVQISGVTINQTSTGTLEFKNTIIGTNGILKIGTGRLLLSATNSYSGITYLNAGTVAIGASGVLGTSNVVIGGSPLEILGSYALSNTITLSSSLVLSGAFNFTLSGNISLNNADRVFTIGNPYLLCSGVISDGGGNRKLTKNGLGELELTNANTNSANPSVQLDNGTITVGNNAALGTNRFLINGTNVTLKASAASLTLANPVDINNNFIFEGNNDLTLSSTAVQLTNGDRTVTINGSRTLTLTNGLKQNGTRGLTKAGTGTLVFRNSSNFSNFLRISNDGGIVRLAGDATLAKMTATPAGITIGSNATLDIDNTGTSLGGAVSGLSATYWQNTTFSDPSAMTRVDANINFDIGVAGWPTPLANSNFSVRWTGKITPTYTGTYRFDPRTDDGVKLTIDGVVIVNQLVDRGVPGQEVFGNYGDINLNAGQSYDIQMDFYQGGGGGAAFLYYRTLDDVIPYQIVPSSVLSTNLATSRIADNENILLNGGNIKIKADNNKNVQEVVGSITFNSGTNTITAIPTGTGTAQIRASGGLARNNGALLNFYRNSTSPEGNLFATGFSDNASISWASVNGLPAMYDLSPTEFGVVPNISKIKISAGTGNWGSISWKDYSGVGTTTPGTGDDVIIRHQVTLTGATSVNSVIFDSGTTDSGTLNPQILGSGIPLTIESGSILANGTATPTISCDVVLATQGNINHSSTGTMTISGVVSSTAGSAAEGTSGFWKFDENTGTTAVDSSGNNYTGTLNNTPTWVAPGRVGTSSLSFNGTNQYVSVPTFNWGGGAVTVAFWAKDTGSFQNSFAFGVGNGAGSIRFSAHVPWSDGNIYWDYGNINANGRITTSYGGATSNWKHITLVSGGTTGGFKAIYINGTLVASATVSDSVGAGATPLEIGRSPESTGANFHKGSIDDFRIYNRVLTESEISLLAGGRGTDGTGLTKAGSGTLVLSNTSNSYTGSTTVLGGTLLVSADGVLGNANNSVNLNGGTLKLAAALTTSRLVSVQSAGGTIDNNGFDLTLNQPMFGAGNLTKQNTGNLILSVANGIAVRTGTTTLNAGTIQIGASTNGTYSCLGSGAVTLNNSAILQYDSLAVANERLPNPINLNNTTTLRGTGAMQSSSFTSNIITVGSGAKVTFDAPLSTTVFRLFSGDNQLRGGGNGSTITMPGAGRIAFMNNNSSGLYVGDLQLNGGSTSQLQLNNSNSLSATANKLRITSGMAFANAAITCPNPISLEGGSISTNNQTVIWNGNVSVTAPSTIHTNGFGGGSGAMTFNGALSGSAALLVTGNGIARTVTFTNPGNTYSGTITSNTSLAQIELRPTGSPALSGPPATVSMAGTKLSLRSDANTTFSTNVSLTPVTPPTVGDGSASLLANVPEAAGYKLVYQLDIPTTAAYNTTAPAYGTNISSSVTYPFDRIAYYMELTNGAGTTTWAYVSMDAFTTDPSKIAVPCIAGNTPIPFYQQLVNNMNVYSNVAGVVTGTGITTGNIEFWPSNYSAATTSIVPGGSGSTLDFNDSGANTSAGYGSMQIHNYGAAQTIIAYNHWTSGTSEVGIGNAATGNPDYTFSNNATSYTVRKLQVLIRPGGVTPTIDVNNQSSGTSNTISLNNLSIAADTLNVTGGNSYRAAFAGTTTMTGNAIFNPTSADLTLGGVVSGAFNLTKIGAGSLSLNAANTYSGVTAVKAGTLFLGNNTALGSGSGNVTLMDGPTNANASILATGPYTIGRNISVNNTAAGKATLGATNTSGTATFSGGITLFQNLSLTAAASGTVNFSGQLSDGASSYQLTKEGNGTVALSNLIGNAYDGGTSVSTGTLQVNNTSGSGTGTGAVTINGTSLLRGTGLITGAVNVAASTGSVWPGTTTLNSDTKQTLTAASANFGTNGSKLTVRATSTGPTGSFTADKLTITGSGTPLVLGGASTLYIDFATAAGNYTNFQSNPLLQTNAGELITSPFTNVTVVSGGVPYTGSGLTILYLNTAGTTVATQQTNGSVTSTSFAANRIVLNLNGTVTPATIATFSAKADGGGALVEWDCSSEYDNLGFNVWRRAFGSEGWSKVNSHMIAGRITSPEGKRYSFYDWNAAEAAEQVEYRLESVSVRGEHEFYKLLAGPIAVAADAPEISLVSLASAIESALTEVRTERAMAAAKLANEPQQFEIGNAVPNAEPDVKIRPIARATELRSPRTTSRTVASNASNSQLPIASSHAIGSRSVSARSITASIEAVKVVYSGSGVLFVPSASLPAGYDVNFLSITREGKSVTALAVLPDGLLLYAPGYADDYTDKDAFFLSASTSPTSAGTINSAQNLFDGSAAANTAPATASVEYHDVYYDYGMLPLVFPPWFSDKYLTQGSVQSFSLSTPNLASGTATLTVDLWSMTQSSAVDPDHVLQAFVNGNAIGSVSWDGGNKAMSLSFTVPDGVLLSGANTIELLTPDLGFEQLSMVHGISIDYVKALTASAPTSIVSNAAQRFELSGLANANIWIVNTSTGSLTPSEAQAQADGSFNVRFDAAANTTYLAVPQGSEIAPLMVAERTIKPLSAGITYLAVGPKQFATEIQPLLSARSKQGLVTAFVDQEELFDYYGFGRYGPDPIRKAVRAVKPQYLVLVGRTTYDYRDYAPPTVDPLCPGFLISTTYHSQTISDPVYGDLGKGYPEICVGRFPVNTPEELAVAVAHTLAYKGLPISGQRALMVADEYDPKAGDFALLGDGIVMSSPDIAWQKAYLKVTHATSPDVSEAMRQAASGGADMIVFTGHGTSAGLGLNFPKMLDANLVQSWTGNIVLLQATCNGNWVGRDTPGYRSIATQALTQPQGGIAASISTTTYLTAGPAAEFMQQLIRQYSTDGQTWGQALLKTQQWAYQKSKTGKGVYADMTHTESILGDPALPMYPRINTDGGYVDNGSPNNPGTGTGGGDGGNPVPPGGNQNGGGATLTVSKLVGKVLYRASAHDTIAVSGYVSNLPEMNTAGMSVTLNIGGVSQQFTLDAKGTGRTKNGAFKLGPATTNGVRIFRATLKGALAGNWTDEGVSSTAASGNVEIAVDLKLGGTTCSTNVSTSYKNVNGKAGRLQKSK